MKVSHEHRIMKATFNSIQLIVGLLIVAKCNAFDGVIVYFADVDYKGDGYGLQMNRGICYNLGLFDDRISSIQALSCVYAYENHGCNWNEGRHRQFTEGTKITNLGDFNDIISSFLMC